MDPPSAPSYEAVSQYSPQYPVQPRSSPQGQAQGQPQQESQLSEWWNWITLRRHPPGTYNGGQPYANPAQPVQPQYYQQPDQQYGQPQPPYYPGPGNQYSYAPPQGYPAYYNGYPPY